ncbi:MAG: S41 family peptidase [Negativicutes bacterium]|nr:S41 family peptidase [Negativicutes bacterium]
MPKLTTIHRKLVLACFLAVTVLCTSLTFAEPQSEGHQPLAAGTAPAVTDQKGPASAVTTVPIGPDGKIDLFKAYSISEINQYLSQMDSADLAATLKLLRVMQLAKAKYDGEVSSDVMLAGAVKGAVGALGDPYSLYLEPKTYKEMMITTKGSFGGVGIVLGMKDNILTVVAPIEGTPGDAAGILTGDQVVKIDGQDTKDMALDEAVTKIRGTEGSQVTLTIARAGQETKEYPLVRAIIPIKTVGGKMLESNIGYIRIAMFNESTSEDFAKKLQELADQGMKALILDLRNNPGGLVEQCVKVAGHLVPKGPIVSVIPKSNAPETWYSQLEKPEYPLVVLVNGGSASASEIVAGAVQDTDAGTLIGTKTFGKGSVQNIVPLGDASAVKLTIAHYYTPNGRSIHHVGIEPDIKLEMPDFKETGKDLQLEKAIEVLKEKLPGQEG